MKRALVLCLMLIASTAAADPVTVSGNKDAATVTALAKVRQQMAVCWVRKPPATVTIKVSVGKDGVVTKAAAKTKGAAAQCAAGILAVSTLAPSAKAWKGAVTIASDASGKAADARAVNEALVAGGDTLRRCQGKSPAFVGKVALRVVFGGDGALSDATASVTAGSGGDGVASCVASQAKKLAYPALGGALTYELTVEFGGDDLVAPAEDDLTGGEQPTKKGPIDGDAATAVIARSTAAIRKCAAKSKATGKLKVRVAIAKDGSVTKAELKTSELNDEAVEACVVKVFAKMTFPTASGESVIIYPIAL